MTQQSEGDRNSGNDRTVRDSQTVFDSFVALLAVIVTTLIILTVGSVIAVTLFLSYLSSMRRTDSGPSPAVQHAHHHDV